MAERRPAETLIALYYCVVEYQNSLETHLIEVPRDLKQDAPFDVRNPSESSQDGAILARCKEESGRRRSSLRLLVT